MCRPAGCSLGPVSNIVLSTCCAACVINCLESIQPPLFVGSRLWKTLVSALAGLEMTKHRGLKERRCLAGAAGTVQHIQKSPGEWGELVCDVWLHSPVLSCVKPQKMSVTKVKNSE